jgi:sec-independent protein translocase protein TatC
MSADEEVVESDSMTLTEHLGELRVRIIRSALAISIGMVLIIAFYNQVLDFLIQPYVELCARKPADFCDPTLNTFSPTEGIATRMRVGMYGGIIAALPVLLASIILFAAGGTLAYLTVGQALDFLISWSGSDVNQIFSVTSYVTLIGLMIFAFGIGFLLPVFVVGLILVNAVSPNRLLKSWRMALVIIAVIAAVITPSGDPVTMALLGVPMMVLYFLAIFIGWLVVRRRPVEE